MGDAQGQPLNSDRYLPWNEYEIVAQNADYIIEFAQFFSFDFPNNSPY